MDGGYLKQFFTAVAVKCLSAVESEPSVSNQHEYNGVSSLKSICGTDTPKKTFPAMFLYLSDDEEIIEANDVLTWYDARYNHPSRTEWRLYYPTNDVTLHANAGDTLFICMKPDRTILEIIVKKNSVMENQLFWLFDIRPDDDSNRFVTKTNLSGIPSSQVSFVAKTILARIGIELPENNEAYTDILIRRYGNAFPATAEFSEFARTTVDDADPVNEPDMTLLRWYEREEQLFKCMERIVIRDRLARGFIQDDTVDVDAFIRYSLSVNNRRKARAGLSFENNLKALFDYHGLKYSHTPVTENRSRPDFVFPCIELYRDPACPSEYLTMLGAKTTAKDRWRQVLEEADRIEKKHLITLEGAISENQTNEMISRNLQLVIPEPIHQTFNERQRNWLFTVADFLALVHDRQLFFSRRGI